MEKKLQALSKVAVRSQPCTKVQSLFGKQSIAALEKGSGSTQKDGVTKMVGNK